MTSVGTTVRKAVITDIHAILELINSYAANGIMLPRTEFEMAENIRDFSVAYDDARLLGCGALHFYTPTTAEVRSLAVRPELKQHGVGRAIVESLEKEARENALESIFAFTYAPGFFSKVGFGEIDRGELPLKAWKDCLRCPKFQNCDEIAVLKRLRPAEAHPTPTFEAYDSSGLLQIEPALLPRIAPNIANKKLKY
ncbi:MAG TPA: N-acetyltransferase [Bryobacteraceae bacterium]|nr:N-acetyltransferase [Bryobacteraceae bacterium]